MNGRSTRVTTGLGSVEVSGRRRVPSPPTRITRLHHWPSSRRRRRRASARRGRRPRRQAGRADRRGVQRVAAVDRRRARHRPGHRGPVELAELLPLGDEHDGVGARRRTSSASSANSTPLHAACAPPPRRPGRRRATRAPAACRRALSTSEVASRMSSVFGLKARPSSAMRLPTSVPRCFCELAHDAALLQLVDLDDRVEQLEVVAGVARELLERA